MSTASAAPGFGLYFIDILACMVFCLTLALVSARFGRETTVEIALPELEGASPAHDELTAPSISLRNEAGGVTRFYWEQEVVSLATLRERLAGGGFERVVVRVEESPFTEVVASAKAAGVHDIDIAYEVRAASGATGRSGR